MKLKEYSLIIKIMIGFTLGIILGEYLNTPILKFIIAIKNILGQIIAFTVPLIILGFITPAITKMKANANKMLISMLSLAYLSSVGAAFFSMIAGYNILPHLKLSLPAQELIRKLPDVKFKIDIPPIISVMSALILALFIGLAVIWTKSKNFEDLLNEFNNIILLIVNKIIIPILPIYIFSTLAILSYKGEIKQQLPVFAQIVGIVLIGHFIWLTFLYTIAGIISKKNPIEVIKHYGPAYMTAVGTMSSAATLPVALSCAKKSKILNPKIVDFAIPMGATVHLCGSVLTEVFFVMAVYKIYNNTLPDFSTMILFILLLGIFAIGAPGVPGGTVMASLGIIISVLGFKDAGIVLMLTIFALQDSFGTACNVTGDGALALILNGLFKKEL